MLANVQVGHFHHTVFEQMRLYRTQVVQARIVFYIHQIKFRDFSGAHIHTLADFAAHGAKNIGAKGVPSVMFTSSGYAILSHSEFTSSFFHTNTLHSGLFCVLYLPINTHLKSAASKGVATINTVMMGDARQKIWYRLIPLSVVAMMK